MPIPRRNFLQTTAAFALGAAFLPPLGSPLTLRLLHTNDWHGRFVGLDQGWVPGGLVNPTQVGSLRALRQANPLALLVDAGDLLQPGRVDEEQGGQFLSDLAYDVFLPGSVEWRAGWAGLERLREATPCRILRPLSVAGVDAPYALIERAGLKVAFVGLDRGPHLPAGEPKEPIGKAIDQLASRLRQEQGAQVVVVLSRLGLMDTVNGPGDLTWVAQTTEVDLVIGGGSHTFMEEPLALVNAQGRCIWINHAGAEGAVVGSLDLVYHPGIGLDLQFGKNIVL